MDLSYFQKINNVYNSKSKQETDLYLLNQHIEECFADTIDYHEVKRNGKDFDLIISKDTDNNTFKKKIKSRPSNPVNLGDYIEWNGQIWLVVLLDPDDKTYSCGYMHLCTILLRYQNSAGHIIGKWCYAEDYTKYSTGEKGNNVITVGDYQYGITTAVDAETRKLKRGKRFVIDYDGNYPPETYELTNRKCFLNDNTYFNRGGVITFTLSHGHFNDSTDKLVTLDDGTQVWICDYSSSLLPDKPPDETEDSNVLIIGTTKLKCGYSREYSVKVADSNGNEVPDYVLNWNIISEFEVFREIKDNAITLTVENEDSIGSSFLLQAIVNDIATEIEIFIIEAF